MLARIDQWTRPEKVPATLVTLFDQSVIYPSPYGVVLVLGAWNYPLQLPLLPVSGAIAAGNCVIIKPSEMAPATAALLAQLIPKYLDPECYRVVLGGIPETTELLKEKFDHIFYTGSTHVGKIVREAANKHLTPTTLELGGKSPVYIDETVNMDIAVKRIIWGKCINMGQTCVAPDYILCTKAVQEKFIEKAKEAIKEWYGEDPKQSPDLCRIINDRNFSRIVEYLKDGKPVVGGGFDAAERWIEPTILVDVSADSKVMTEEIFGPILPIMTVNSPTDAINFVNAREKPLAFYVFSENDALVDILLNEVSFGGSTVNDVIFHLAVPGLPFGGVGNSGMGAYHGKASFDTFSHRKSCLIRNYNRIADFIGSYRYAPYSDGKVTFLSFMLKERNLPPVRYLKYAFAFALGAVSLYAAQEIAKKGVRELVNEKARSVGDIMRSLQS
ncbi:UNVERIFIED_CONTAM: hypothetical protein GTU68_022009 [Idotea baltica]|nr:hypothetical protein [Idotea baltica]